MKTIKKLLTCALLFGFASIANAAVSLAGSYYCKGYDPYANVKYAGPVTIKQIGHTYSVTWDLGDSQIYTGTGLLDKNQKVFSVLFYNDQNVKSAGLSVYEVMPNDTLTGQWVMNNEDKIATESCVKQK
jgi:hypothetical protein